MSLPYTLTTQSKLFTRIEDSVDYAEAGNTPFAPDQVVAKALTVLQYTEIFPNGCKVFKRLPANNKTWDCMKADLTIAQTCSVKYKQQVRQRVPRC